MTQKSPTCWVLRVGEQVLRKGVERAGGGDFMCEQYDVLFFHHFAAISAARLLGLWACVAFEE